MPFPLLIAVAGFALAQEPTPWRSLGTTDGILLEVRNLPDTSFEEIRATAESADGLDRICAAAFAKGRHKLEGRLKERVLLRETDTEHWSYERIGIPVLSDRDYVLHVKLVQPASTGRCEIAFESIDDPEHPKLPGVVRLAVHGHWTVAPGADGKSLLTYVVYSDPGGGVPALFAKNGQRSAAIELVKRILARAHAENAQ